jgi:hypothetical protein
MGYQSAILGRLIIFLRQNKKRVGGRKEMTRPISIFLIIVSLNGTASAMTAKDWLRLEDREQQRIYIEGLFDAWFLEVDFCNQHPKDCGTNYKVNLEPIISCVKKLRYGQILAIVTKDVNDDPEEWDKSMASYAWLALIRACEKKQ